MDAALQPISNLWAFRDAGIWFVTNMSEEVPQNVCNSLGKQIKLCPVHSNSSILLTEPAFYLTVVVTILEKGNCWISKENEKIKDMVGHLNLFQPLRYIRVQLYRWNLVGKSSHLHNPNYFAFPHLNIMFQPWIFNAGLVCPCSNVTGKATLFWFVLLWTALPPGHSMTTQNGKLAFLVCFKLPLRLILKTCPLSSLRKHQTQSSHLSRLLQRSSQNQPHFAVWKFPHHRECRLVLCLMCKEQDSDHSHSWAGWPGYRVAFKALCGSLPLFHLM